MKKTRIKILLTLSLCFVALGSLVACGSANNESSTHELQIAVPSDTTNEARALLLLEDQGLIPLADGAGLQATANDIVDNPYNINIVETEAASLPRTLADVDMAVINGNYALSGGVSPEKALASEDSHSAAAVEYANVIAVRAEDAGSEKTKVLVEILQSEEVKKFINDNYDGAVIPVDVAALPVSDSKDTENTTIKVGASPAPHAEILAFAKDLIEERGYTLEIVEFSDYVQPNLALSDGEIDANYFQHYPYLEDYNKENGTKLASAAKIHFEPLSLYAGKTTSIQDLKSE